MSQVRLRPGHRVRLLEYLRARLPLQAMQPWRMRSIVRGWIARSAQRHALSQLDAHRLKDIGLTKQDVERECSKRFWQ